MPVRNSLLFTVMLQIPFDLIIFSGFSGYQEAEMADFKPSMTIYQVYAHKALPFVA